MLLWETFSFHCCAIYKKFTRRSKMNMPSNRTHRQFLVKGLWSLNYFFCYFLTVNGGYSHCNLVSEKKNMMDMEMTSSSVPVCRQGLFIHTGNPLMRDHPLSCERLLHVGQLNLTHSDIRYHCKFYGSMHLAPLECLHIVSVSSSILCIQAASYRKSTFSFCLFLEVLWILV